MNVEASHFVQRVEHDGVLPGKDGDGKRSMAQHKIGFEPGAAEARIRTNPAHQGLQDCRHLHEVAEV